VSLFSFFLSIFEVLLFFSALILRGYRELKRIREIGFEVLKREFTEFSTYYRSSRTWWITSVVGATLAAIIGGTNQLANGFVAMVFIAPAIGYYWWFSPFGLKCEYTQADEETNPERECYPRAGKYTVPLEMTPGASVIDYRLDVHTPAGAEIVNIDGHLSHLDDQRQILYGVAEESGETAVDVLYVEKTGSIAPDGELLLIKSQGKNNTIEWVRLMPDDKI
jgi:hypothetical protein